MYPGITVIKRNGRIEALDIYKIKKVVTAACRGLKNVDPNELESDAQLQFRDKISTEEIQQTLIKTAVDKIDIDRPDWNFVAARLFLYDLYHKVTGFTGYNHLKDYFKKGEKEGRLLPGLKDKYDLEDLNSYIRPKRDLQFTYLGIKTLYDRYLLKDKNGNPIELPQHLFMGVAMFLAQNETNPESIPEIDRDKVDLKNPKSIRGYWAKKFYDVISKFEVMVATPTLSNARTTRHQLSSCYLGSMNDNIEGIFDDFKEMALLSKYGGGIGWDVSKIRALGSFIDNHKNAAGGVIPWLKITNDIAIAVDQLGCVREDSEVIKAEKIRYQGKIFDLSEAKRFYTPDTVIDMVAAYASKFAFEITVKGKTYSKNFVSTFIYDYIKLSKSYAKSVEEINREYKDSEKYKNLKIAYLKEKFYNTMSKYYNVEKSIIEDIILKYSKINKGIPYGFELRKSKNDRNKNILFFKGNGFFIILDAELLTVEKIGIIKEKDSFNKMLIQLIDFFNNKETDKTSMPVVADKKTLFKIIDKNVKNTDVNKFMKVLLDIFIPLRNMELLWTPDGLKISDYLTWDLIIEWCTDIKNLKILNMIINHSNKLGYFKDINGNFDENQIINYRFINNSKFNEFLTEIEKKGNYQKLYLDFLENLGKILLDDFNNIDIEQNITEIKKIKEGNFVLSYDILKHQPVYKKVLGTYDIDVKIKDQIKIELETGTVIVTSAWHPFPILRKDKKSDEYKIVYVRSDEVKENDYTVRIKADEKNLKDCVARVKKVSFLNSKETYEDFKDLTVEDTNNYFCRIKGSDKSSFGLIHNTRKGAIAVYIEPWHMDIMDFLDLKKNSGEERRRAHDLFPALWIPDLFMKRVEEDGWWTLFDPYDVADLTDCYGKEFEKRYKRYEQKEDIPKKRVKAKELWKKILLEYYETGNPFLCFKDNANERNQNNHAGIIRSSNLCVTGNTRLATQFGLVKAEDLFKMREKIKATYDLRTDGNRKKYGTSVAECIEMHKTKENAKVYKIVTKEGYEIECTDWHEFYVVRNEKIIKIPLKDVRISDKLLVQSDEGQFGNEGSFELGFLTGYLTKKRRYEKCETDKIVIKENEDFSFREKIYNYIENLLKNEEISKNKTKIEIKNNILYNSGLKEIFNKYGLNSDICYKVPEFIYRGSKECVRGYLKSLFYKYGDLNFENKNDVLILGLYWSNKEFLKEIQYILSNFGIKSYIKILKRRRRKPFYRLIIKNINVINFSEKIGFLRKNEKELIKKVEKNKKLIQDYKKEETYEVSLKEIYFTGEEDVYDTTQLINHSLIFNGIVTGNCTEIYQNTEPNHYKVKIEYEDGSYDLFEENDQVEVEVGEGIKKNINANKITSIHIINGKKVYFTEKIATGGKTAVCNLASVNLSKVNTPEKIAEVIPIAIRMLDNVIDLNFYPVRKTKDTNLKNRAIGLGAMGEAQMLAEKQIFWGSDEHFKLIDEIFEGISYHAINTSCDLAREKGIYPEFEGSRWSKGILPIDTVKKEVKDLVKREYVCNWDDLREKVKKGIRNGYLMAIAPTSSISILTGTTQTIEPVYKRKWYEENLSGLIPVVVPNLSADTYMFYTTAYEIDQKTLVKAAAIRQKWIDQGQSLNIFVDPEKVSGKYLHEIYTLGWKLGLKSFYYLRSKSPEAKEDVMDRSVECYGCQ